MNNHTLVNYLLHLADDALILGHRNSEWCGHGPALEQDIALSNIALDLIGQARNFYQYAATIINLEDTVSLHASDIKPATENSLAYLRNAEEFKNCLLVEQLNGDWGKTIMRQFLFSTYQYYLYLHLQKSTDVQIAAISAKALKEVTYHVRWSSEWVIRLGDGTDESHSRMINALNELWAFTEEMFIATDYETQCIEEGISIDLPLLKKQWKEKIQTVFQQATLPVPKINGIDLTHLNGKKGRHTPYLNELLSEMQFLQRTFPGCDW